LGYNPLQEKLPPQLATILGAASNASRKALSFMPSLISYEKIGTET